MSSPTASSDVAERPTGVRYLVLTFLALAMACAYLDRVMSAATTTIEAELGYQDKDMGPILGGFALGYMWFQVPGGWLGTRFGARLVLPAMSVLWSLCTAWISLAPTGEGIYWGRIALGLAQGGLIPCAAKVLVDWIPLARRGIASAVMGAAMQVGAVLNNGLTGQFLQYFPWRSIYLGYSMVGIAWAVAFFWLFRNRPEEHPWVNRAELDLIRGALSLGPAPDSGRKTPEADKTTASTSGFWVAAAMALSVTLWAMNFQAFCRAFGYGFFTSWFPAFLEKARGLEKLDSAMLNMVPLASFGVGSIPGGLLVDWLWVKTNSKWVSRNGTAILALSLCALCTMAATWVDDPQTAAWVIGLGSFLAGMAGPPVWAAVMDISGKYTAVVGGVMNMSGNIGDWFCSWGLGYLFTDIQNYKNHPGQPNLVADILGRFTDWNLVLYVFVAIYLAGAVFWLFLNPNRSVVDWRRA